MDIRSVRRCCALSLSCFLVLSFAAGCGKDGDADSPGAGGASVASSGEHLQIPLPPDSSLDFTLDNSDPQFGNKVNLTQTPDYSDQSLQAGDTSQDDGQLEVGTGVDGSSSDEGGEPSEGTDQPAIPSKPPKEVESQLTKEPPTDDNKYPNTGMFLEDD